MPDRPKNQIISAADHTRLRTHLGRMGVRAADLGAATGASAGGRTRKKMADDVIAWLRNLRKG